jgi:hypothetical protein
MRITVRELRQTIRDSLLEAVGAMRLLDVVRFRLILSKEKKVEEILTAIRIIKGVATVSQTQPMQRMPNGTRTMEVAASIDAGDIDIMVYIDAMARKIKQVPDVTTVVIRTLNDQPVRDASGKKKLVY